MLTYTAGEKGRVLKAGSIILSTWGGIHGFLAALILVIVLFLHGNSPLLGMVFDKSEIASMDAAMNTFDHSA